MLLYFEMLSKSRMMPASAAATSGSCRWGCSRIRLSACCRGRRWQGVCAACVATAAILRGTHELVVLLLLLRAMLVVRTF